MAAPQTSDAFADELRAWMCAQGPQKTRQDAPRVQSGRHGRYFVARCPGCDAESYFLALSPAPRGDFDAACEDCGLVGLADVTGAVRGGHGSVKSLTF